MNSWFVWLAFALVAIALGLISYFFSLRVLRVAAAIVALATVAYLTWYSLTHPAKASGSLSDAFTRGVDGQRVQTDAIDFIRTLSGRLPGTGILSHPLPL